MISLLFSCNVFCNRFDVCVFSVSLFKSCCFPFLLSYALSISIYLSIFPHKILCFVLFQTKNENKKCVHYTFSILISSSSINYYHTRIPPWWYHWWFDRKFCEVVCCCELRIYYCCLHRPHSFIALKRTKQKCNRERDLSIYHI